MVQEDAKVSIILPTYNGARYIRRSIDSCLQQTYKNIELIIVDDSSTDETPDIVKSYKDERIKYIRHQKNRGLPSGLNTGFANAVGHYLTWTSDDNYYATNAIEKMVKFSKERDCQFVYCDFYLFNDENPSNLKLITKPDVTAFEIGNSIGACFLYSREVKKAVGEYDPDTILAEDYDYWIRVSQKFPMCHLNEPLYFYRVHGESLTSRFSRQYEIQAVSILVRIKSNLMDVEEATRQFIDLIAEKMALTSKPLPPVFLIGFITFKRIMRPLYRFLTRMRFAEKINKILRDFQMRRISFNNAKSSLKDIINSPLI